MKRYAVPGAPHVDLIIAEFCERMLHTHWLKALPTVCKLMLTKRGLDAKGA